MALSLHEQEILIAFAEEHFKDLPEKCLELYKEEPKVPGFGKVKSDGEMLTLKVSLSLSLLKSYENHIEHKDNLCLQLADLFAQEYSMNILEVFIDTISVEESLINTTVAKLLKYCKIERNPIIVTSPKISEIFATQRGFIGSDITQIDMESGYFYEVGKIRNVTIVVDPLQTNLNYAYLISGNIMDYKLINTNEESFISYNLSEDGTDINAVFKPVIMLYEIDLTGMNHKFFNILDE